MIKRLSRREPDGGQHLASSEPGVHGGIGVITSMGDNSMVHQKVRETENRPALRGGGQDGKRLPSVVFIDFGGSVRRRIHRALNCAPSACACQPFLHGVLVFASLSAGLVARTAFSISSGGAGASSGRPLDSSGSCVSSSGLSPSGRP